MVSREPRMEKEDSKWYIKYGNEGPLDRFKARVVARGFVQEHSIDFDETFSQMVRFTSHSRIYFYY